MPLEPKRPYKKPEIGRRYDFREVEDPNLFLHKDIKDKVYIKKREVSKAEYDLLVYLKVNGVPVEVPFHLGDLNVNWVARRMAFLNAGKSIYDYLKENPEANRTNIFNQIALGIGRMHASNCAWNDLKSRHITITIHEGMPIVNFIDFEPDYSRYYKNLDWTDKSEIFEFFNKDIDFLKRTIPFLVKHVDYESTFKYILLRILYQYPCTEKVKKKLYDYWTSDL